MFCPCQTVIDPSVSTVLSLLKKHSYGIPPERVIFHYYGQGCHEPTSEGDLFFFSDDRNQCKSLKLTSICSVCASNLCFVFDCNSAGSLAPLIRNGSSNYAFFATRKGERLPVSENVPLDLFSCCLCNHLETGMWWHAARKKTKISDVPVLPGDAQEQLHQVMESVLDAIAFESQAAELYEEMTADKSVAVLFRGYFLAQRIMAALNVHPCSIPESRCASKSTFWEMWDLAIDYAMVLPYEKAIVSIFSVFINTFSSFPSLGFLPLCEQFITMPEFSERTCQCLWSYLDTESNAVENLSRTKIVQLIMQLESPSESSLLALAKSIAHTNATPFAPESQLFFTKSKIPGVISAGMLCVCCSIGTVCFHSFLNLLDLCMEMSESCAPISPILMGLLLENMDSLTPIPAYEARFIDLLQSEREDVRAATVFCLGFSRSTNYFHSVASLVNDASPMVRIQVLFALTRFLKLSNDPHIRDVLQQFDGDSDTIVQELYTSLTNTKTSPLDLSFHSVVNPLLSHVIHSVNAPGFSDRLQTNIFDIPMNLSRHSSPTSRPALSWPVRKCVW